MAHRPPRRRVNPRAGQGRDGFGHGKHHWPHGNYKHGQHWVVCMRCGFDYHVEDIRVQWDNLIVCKWCWEPRHPQDFVRGRRDRIAPPGPTNTAQDYDRTEVGSSTVPSGTFGDYLTPVNEAPTIVTNTGTTGNFEDTVPILQEHLQATDPDDTSADLTFTVSSGPSQGQLELTTDPNTAITSFTQEDIDLGKLVYRMNTFADDSFTFTVSDGTNTTSADTFSINRGLPSTYGCGEQATTFEGAVLDLAPLAYWPLDESSGTSYRDLTGNSRVMTYNNGSGNYTYCEEGPYHTNGNNGASGEIDDGAPDFPSDLSNWMTYDVGDGAFDFLGTGDPSGVPYTIIGWFRTRSSATGVAIVSKAEIADNWAADVAVTGDGKLTFQMNNTNATPQNPFCKSTGTVNDGNWHFFAAVRDDGNTEAEELRIYVDGTEHGSTSVGKDDGYGETDRKLAIGQRDAVAEGGGGVSGMNGQIAHIAVFDKVLTAAQILSLYNSDAV